jgi:hypothetical protein
MRRPRLVTVIFTTFGSDSYAWRSTAAWCICYLRPQNCTGAWGAELGILSLTLGAI